MDDRQLLDELLHQQESDILDFKSAQYCLDDAKGKSKFIKDIAAMVNTPRDGPAYILVGVQEQSGRVTATPGVAYHPDESELGRIIQSRLEPAPRFSYRRVQHDHLDIGLIEIPCDQTVAVLPRNDYGVLRRKALYTRRNTQNTEADTEDIRRITEWSLDKPSPDLIVPTGTWEQLYRACDGFDSRKIYLAVLGKESKLSERDWTAMASVRWNIIVDFDTDTDTDGNYASAQQTLSERQALHALRLGSAISHHRTVHRVASRGGPSLATDD